MQISGRVFCNLAKFSFLSSTLEELVVAVKFTCSTSWNNREMFITMKTPGLTCPSRFLSASTSPLFPGHESTLSHWIGKQIIAFHEFKGGKRK